MKKTMNAVVQALSNGIHTGCLECGKTIRNPICQNCLSNEFAIWLSNYPNLENKIADKVKEYIETEEKLAVDSQDCVVCNNSHVSVCPYCFTSFLLNLLIDIKAKKQILQEYLELFNFDLGDFNGHWGYFREGEKLEIL